MLWIDSVTADAPYADILEKIFGESEIIWENSDEEHANFLAQRSNGQFAHYEYGPEEVSKWDDLDLSGKKLDDYIKNYMELHIGWFDSLEEVLHYLGFVTDANKDMVFRFTNPPTNKSDLDDMRDTFMRWQVHEGEREMA